MQDYRETTWLNMLKKVDSVLDSFDNSLDRSVIRYIETNKNSTARTIYVVDSVYPKVVVCELVCEKKTRFSAVPVISIMDDITENNIKQKILAAVTNGSYLMEIADRDSKY